MNPGGIRADLAVDHAATGNVTYGAAFTVQPFNNFLVSMDLTGAQIETLLEQQFTGANAAAAKVLQVRTASPTPGPRAAPGSQGRPGVDQARTASPLDPGGDLPDRDEQLPVRRR